MIERAIEDAATLRGIRIPWPIKWQITQDPEPNPSARGTLSIQCGPVSGTYICHKFFLSDNHQIVEEFVGLIEKELHPERFGE